MTRVYTSKWNDETISARLNEMGKVYIREVEHGERGQRRRRIEYICICGRRRVSDLRHAIKLDGCMECLHERRREPFDKVKESFENLELILFSDESEYQNSDSSLKCACVKCGWYGVTRYAYVHSGCRPCHCHDIALSESRRGENNPYYGHVGAQRGKTGPLSPRWNPERSLRTRELERDSAEYEEWRRSIFERDNYTCQCCGSHGTNLRAHHLFPYHKYKDLRYSIENGICVCKTCHDTSSPVGFHHIFGTRNNTPYQFWAYVGWRRKQLGLDSTNEEVDRSTQHAV